MSNDTYQEDIDANETQIDPVTDELTENPADELRIPEDELKNELDKSADDGLGRGDDDMREAIEDADEDDGKRD